MRRSTRVLQHTAPEGMRKRQSRECRPAVEGLEQRALLSAAHELALHKHFAVHDDKTANDYEAIPLVSDIPYLSPPAIYDPSLVDPWDVNFPQKPGIEPPPEVWVTDQGTGEVTMYAISMDGSTITKSALTVTIPTVGSSTPSGPTGVVQDPTNSFAMKGGVPATYIFDTLQGTIEDYNPVDNGSAQIVFDNSSMHAQYTGLATGTVGSKHYIFAANAGASPGIDVYNQSFSPAKKLSSKFVDKELPPGFTPYGVRDLNNDLFVMYRGPNGVGGAVAKFHNDGMLIKNFASDTTSSGNLQTPSGMAYINRGFGKFSNDLLVSNLNTGQIDAYKLGGKFVGKLLTTNGSPLTIPELRSIHFGPGLGTSGPKAALLFTAGTPLTPGLYGMITPVT